MAEKVVPIPSNPLADMIKEAVIEGLQEAFRRNLESPTPRWPEVMSLKMAALYLDRTESAVRKLITANILPVMRVDDRLQVRRMDIDRIAERYTLCDKDRRSA